jgi:hypothetical protein
VDAAVWGFVGTLVGALISIGTTILSHRHAAVLQRQANDLDRQERARAFQRENLISLQDALQLCTRAVGKAVHEDIMAVRRGIPWGQNQIDSDLDETMRSSNARVYALVERVADDPLREAIRNYQTLLNSLLLTPDQRAAEAKFNRVTDAIPDVMAQLGTVLRRLY